MSDLHGYLPSDITECDIVCICGDIIPTYIQNDPIKCITWLAGPFQTWALNLPCKNVILIWGNHDFIGQELYKQYAFHDRKSINRGLEGYEQSSFLFDSDSEYKIRILLDSEVKLNGIKFYGTSWCPELRNWAFFQSKDDLIDKFYNIPEDTDILLTHCPPKFGTQGVVLDKNNWSYLKDFGCEELQTMIKFKLNEGMHLVLSGHIHSGNHNTENNENIHYRNVSIKDENYEVNYQPYYFEWDS